MLSDFILEALKKRPMTARELRMHFNTQEHAIIDALATLDAWDVVEAYNLKDIVYYALKKDKKEDEKKKEDESEKCTLEYKFNIKKFREDKATSETKPVSSLESTALSYDEWSRIVEEEHIESVAKSILKKPKT